MATKLDERADWLRVFAGQDGHPLLLIGNNPSLPPHGPRLDRFGKKRFQGFVGKLSITQLGKKGEQVARSQALALMNPGNMIFSHHAFDTSWELLRVGDRMHFVGTAWFPNPRSRNQSRVWSLVHTTSVDEGKTWSKPAFHKKAWPGTLLRPALLEGKNAALAMFGDRFDKKLVQLQLGKDGAWKPAEHDLGKSCSWNLWYDAWREKDKIVVIDTIPLPAKKTKTDSKPAKKPTPRYGIGEFESADGGKTWKHRLTLALDMDQAYAGRSARTAFLCCHLLWKTACLSMDGGKTWVRRTVPDPFTTRETRMTLLAGRGAVISTIARAEGRSHVRLVFYSP